MREENTSTGRSWRSTGTEQSRLSLHGSHTVVKCAAPPSSELLLISLCSSLGSFREIMAETAPTAAATKAAKKKSAAKRKKTGPGVGELIVKAVSASKERSGVSLAALKKALAAGGYDVEKNNSRVKIAVKSLVNKGVLVQTKGTGASGSFKLNKKQAETKTKPIKKAAPKAKKPATKKPAAAKKPKTVAAKKPAAKKSPKKVKKPAAKKATKSPKKATKSPKKATKSPKKAATPKKAAKSPKKAKAAKPKAAKPKKTAAKKK
ncbi:histone H1 [Labeo rohita]|uniref:histone H1 n=1 Tax=Labeo rohita TaxID=84645 RepID=UPI0021E29C18|nr:histone H1 [Labeo rohita]